MDFIDYLDENFGFSRVEGGKQLKLEGHCPFCLENRADLRVYVSEKTGLGNCFHCGVGFGPAKFVMAAEGCSWAKAKAILSDDGDGFIRDMDENEEPENQLVWPTLVDICNVPQALDYLLGRGIDQTLIDHFRLFYSPNNLRIGPRLYYTKSRIVIPIHDEKSVPVAWQARDITGRAKVKYLATPGWNSNEHLYNAWSISNNPDYLIICEGVFDVFGWWRAGFKNVVATFGKKISDKQIDIINSTYPKAVFIAWDTDANWKKYEFIESYGWRWPVRIIDLKGKDADEYDFAALLKFVSAAKSYNWEEKILMGISLFHNF